MFIDTHVNLHGEQFADDLDAVIERARAAGVERMIAICCRLSDFEAVADDHGDVVKSLPPAQPQGGSSS